MIAEPDIESCFIFNTSSNFVDSNAPKSNALPVAPNTKPNVFESKHRWIWEQHHGKIPDNHVLVFKNMNKQDCRLENLMLISRAELVRLNQSYRKLATPETNETCVLMAKIKNKTHNLKVA